MNLKPDLHFLFQTSLPVLHWTLLNMSDELKSSFLGALQASLSVLLVILYGVAAAQFDILRGSTTKQISSLCVRIFLPALLITNVGSQLHADTGIRYVPVLSKYPPIGRHSPADSVQYGDFSMP